LSRGFQLRFKYYYSCSKCP